MAKLHQQQGAKLMTIEKIIKRKGETRYCNCDNDNCSEGHGSSPCQSGATVIMTTADDQIQLCPACYEFARGGN